MAGGQSGVTAARVSSQALPRSSDHLDGVRPNWLSTTHSHDNAFGPFDGAEPAAVADV